jgi:hypothetical protein
MKALLSQHLEVMDHEISGNELQLEYQGYRVDGQHGIKNVVGLPMRKSVDYFYIKDQHCLLIEFSDIARGQEDLVGLDISKHQNTLHQSKLTKLLKNDPRDEMATKFKDSSVIFDKLPKYYQELDEPFLNPKPKIFPHYPRIAA